MVKMAWRKIKQKGEEERSRRGFLFPPSSQERPRQQSRAFSGERALLVEGLLCKGPGAGASLIQLTTLCGWGPASEGAR